jgi:hypothetical protein
MVRESSLCDAMQQPKALEKLLMEGWKRQKTETESTLDIHFRDARQKQSVFIFSCLFIAD